MSYCVNPECPQPKNPPKTLVCQTCGSKLTLKDRYLVLKSLGQGGFGATFLAVDLVLPGKPIAVIKQLRPATNVPHLFQMAKELFEREAQTLGRIGNHPQVPRLLDYFEEKQQFYLVQEYIKGNNLQQEVKQNGPFSEAGARQFLSEILPVIQYIHSQQVIHRDIKPANLIRREQDKKLVLIDFGAVKNRVNPEAASTTSEQTALTAFAVGTPGFAPPEQMAMRPVYASDIYAIGVTCIYLLTGRSPKDLDYNPKTGEMVWETFVDISDNFAKVLRRMLEISVRLRYQTADDVLKALEMEPYMESLAQGLSTTNTTTAKANTPTKPAEDVPPSGSVASRLAMAIRARKERQGGPTGYPSVSGQTLGHTAPTPRSPLSQRGGQSASRATSHASNVAGAGAGSKGGKNVPARLDAKGLLMEYDQGRRDFGQLVLSSINLAKTQLAGAIFHQSRLLKANLQGANLAGADFGRANLAQANLRDANLGRAYFSYTNLTDADLRGADLSHAYLNHAILDGTNLCGANLSNAKVSEQQLAKAKTNWATIFPSGKRGLWGG